jgi:hypothetical protein
MHDLRHEYEFSPEQFRDGRRGQYAVRFHEGVNLVSIDPDLAEIFPNAEGESGRTGSCERHSRQGGGREDGRTT